MNPEEIDWEAYIVQLTAYAHDLMDNFSCFSRSGHGSLFAGKRAEDYAMEAIEQYLRNPEKYDPSKGTSLLTYLMRHLVRGIIANDVRLKEFKSTSPMTSFFDDDENDIRELLLPFVEANFDEIDDYQKLRSFIEERVATDPTVENIFTGLYDHELTRRAVIREFKLTESEFDNGFRRLKTIFRQAVVLYKHLSNKK